MHEQSRHCIQKPACCRSRNSSLSSSLLLSPLPPLPPAPPPEPPPAAPLPPVSPPPVAVHKQLGSCSAGCARPNAAETLGAGAALSAAAAPSAPRPLVPAAAPAAWALTVTTRRCRWMVWGS